MLTLSVPVRGQRVSSYPDLGSESVTTTMSRYVPATLQGIVPDVRIVMPMADEQLVQVVHGNADNVKQQTCPIHLALQINWEPLVLDTSSHAAIPGAGDAESSATLCCWTWPLTSTVAWWSVRARNSAVRGDQDCWHTNIAVRLRHYSVRVSE